jgi:hypothetical protein
MTPEQIRRLILTVYYAGRAALEGQNTPVTLNDATKEYTGHLTDAEVRALFEEKATGVPEFANTLIKGTKRII